MATNKLLKALNTQILKTPSLSDCEEALQALQEYTKTRRVIERILTDYNGQTRQAIVDQYFQVKRLLECLHKITFPHTPTDNQSQSVKYFNLEWKGNKTARLYWSSSNGWTVKHKDFNKELGGVWEDFDLESDLEANQLYFIEYVDD